MNQLAVVNNRSTNITAAEAQQYVRVHHDQGLDLACYTGVNIKALTNMPLRLASPLDSFLTAAMSPQAYRKNQILMDHDGTTDTSTFDITANTDFMSGCRIGSIVPALLFRIEPTGVENSLSTTIEITGVTPLGAFSRRFVVTAKTRASHEFMLLPFGDSEAQNMYAPLLVGTQLALQSAIGAIVEASSPLTLTEDCGLTVVVSGGKSKQIRIEVVNGHSTDLIPHVGAMA